MNTMDELETECMDEFRRSQAIRYIGKQTDRQIDKYANLVPSNENIIWFRRSAMVMQLGVGHCMDSRSRKDG